MKIILSKSDLKSESKHLRQYVDLSNTQAQELLVKCFGYEDMHEYTQLMKKAANPYSDVHQPLSPNYLTPLWRIPYKRLRELHSQTTYQIHVHHAKREDYPISYELHTNFAENRGLPVPHVAFIHREFKRRRKQYLDGDNKHSLTNHILLVPTIQNDQSLISVLDETYHTDPYSLDTYINELLARYQLCGIPPMEMREIYKARSYPVSRLTQILESDLYELQVHCTNSSEVDCGESFIFELVTSYLTESISREMIDTLIQGKLMYEYRYQQQLHTEGDCFPPVLVEPFLVPVEEKKKKQRCFLNSLCNEPNPNHRVYNVMDSPKYVFNVGSTKEGEDVLLSKGDLIEGLYINGDNSSNSVEPMNALLNAHVRNGGGLIGFFTDGGYGRLDLLTGAARKANRERDVIFLNKGTIKEYLTANKVKSYLKNNKIVMLDLGCIERTAANEDICPEVMEILLIALRQMHTKLEKFKQPLMLFQLPMRWGNSTYETFKKVRGELARLSVGAIAVDENVPYLEHYDFPISNKTTLEELRRHPCRRIRRYALIKGHFKHHLMFACEERDPKYPIRKEMSFGEFLYEYSGHLVHRDICQLYWVENRMSSDMVRLNNP
ncbi:hypothetical protein [Vibrio crassostreae]|uniref:hypothetical protein n=1 Tax=Vibrio crassostreae TaxID=246167 RepID=UPI001B30D0E3|nr:hypothetical protein [Vibrio crassostreae]